MSKQRSIRTMKLPTAVMLAIALLLGISACGGDARDKAKDNPRSKVVSGGPSSKAILSESELPPSWRYSTKDDFLGIPQMCGIVLEPPGLTSAETRRFAKSYAGPFVIQYSFVSGDEKATTERIDEFVTAAKTCSSSKPTKADEAVVSPIDDIDAVGEAFAAVHATDAKDASNQRDYVVFRDGSQVTVLLSYGIGSLASHADLSAMAEGIAAKTGSSKK